MNNSNSTFKRILSMILVAVMVLGMLPLSAFADSNSNVYDGGKSSTTEHGDDGAYVTVSKNITQSSKGENFLDVTLKVETNATIKSIPSSAAVVLVMDMSGSMKYDIAGKTTSVVANQRVTMAKAAAAEFIGKYAEGATKDAPRLLSVVQFGTNASTVNLPSILKGSGTQETKDGKALAGWVDLGAGVDKVTSTTVKNAVNNNVGINANGNGEATNLSGGLLLANNLLNELSKVEAYQNIEYLYVILLSDGLPTARLVGGAANKTARTYEGVEFNESGLDYKTSGKTTTYMNNMNDPTLTGIAGVYSSGTGASSDKYKEAASKYQAAKIKSDRKATLYSIAYATDKKFLNSISTSEDHCLAASKTSDLTDAFDKIVTNIKYDIDAWTVTDPLGAYMVFDGIIIEGNENPYNTEYTKAAAKYVADGNKITWDLKNDGTVGTSGLKKTYQLTYRIRIDNLAEGFAFNTAYPVNTETDKDGEKISDTILTYRIYKTVNGTETFTPHTKAFPTPTAQAFCAPLEFKKVKRHDGQPLGTATFTLTVAGHPSFALTATSVGANEGNAGQVKFAQIPSGHTFTMTETAPAEYDPAGPFTVEVSWRSPKMFEDKTLLDLSGLEIVNSLNPKNIDVTLKKTFIGFTQDVTVELWSKEGEVETKVDGAIFPNDSASGLGPYTHTFKNLPTVNPKTGNSITYYAKENEANFKAHINDLKNGVIEITNTPTVTEKEITIEKIWKVPSDDMIKEVEFKIYGGDKEITVTLPAGQASITVKVPAYTETGLIESYSVEEITVLDKIVSSQVSKNNTFTFTNQIQQEYFAINGNKVWVDGVHADMQPDSVELTLTQTDGAGNKETFTLDLAKGEDSFTFPAGYDPDQPETGLPKYDANGKEYKYEVSDTVDGYECKWDAEKGLLTNTNVSEWIYKIDVEKFWKDNDDAEGLRPEKIVVTLSSYTEDEEYTDKEELDRLTLNADNFWAGSFGKRSKYDDKTGKEIFYVVEEELDSKSLYSCKPDPIDAEPTKDGFTYTIHRRVELTNKLDDGSIDLKVVKKWIAPDSLLPKSIEVALYAPGNKELAVRTITLSADEVDDEGNWIGAFEGLPVRENGTLIDYGKYIVKESFTDENLFKFRYSFDKSTYTLINRLAQQKEDYVVEVIKTWSNAPDAEKPAVTIKLSLNGKEVKSHTIESEEFKKNNDTVTVRFEGLDRYNLKTGKENQYTVTESFDTKDGLYGQLKTTTYTQQELEGSGVDMRVVFTNAMLPGVREIPVTKAWACAPDDVLDEITLRLYRTHDGMTSPEVVGDDVVITAENTDNWTKSFLIGGLAEVDVTSAGQKYTYFAEELEIEGWISTQLDKDKAEHGFKLVNKKESQQKDITITKHWIGPVPKGIDSVSVELTRKAEGTDKEHVGTYKLTDSNAINNSSWQLPVKGLDSYNDQQKPYTYTVEEVGFDYESYGFKAPVVDNFSFTVTNEIKQVNDVVVEGEKVWVEALHTPDIEVQLYADDQLVEGRKATVNAASDWKFSFSGLPRYALSDNGVCTASDGSEIKYTVREVGEAGKQFSYYEDGKFVEEFDVSYSEDEEGRLIITNSHSDGNVYEYVIIRNYTLYTEKDSTGFTNTLSDKKPGTKGERVDIDPIAFRDGDKIYDEYKFVDGDVDGGTLGSVVVLLEAGHIYKITLNYEKPYTQKEDEYQYQIIRNYTDTYYPLQGESTRTTTTLTDDKTGNKGDKVEIDPVAIRDADKDYSGYDFVNGSVDGGTLESVVVLLEAGHIYKIILNYERIRRQTETVTERPPYEYTERPGTSSSTTPIVDITPDPTPLTDIPAPVIPDPALPVTLPEIIILEPDVPMAALPKTGYDGDTGKNGFLAALSMGLLTLAAALGLRKEEDETEA